MRSQRARVCSLRLLLAGSLCLGLAASLVASDAFAASKPVGKREAGVRRALLVGINDYMSPEISDLRGVTVEDLGGRVGLARDGAPLDINYLALQVEIKPAEASGSTVYLTQPAADASAQEPPPKPPADGIIIRGEPKPPPAPPKK